MPSIDDCGVMCNNIEFEGLWKNDVRCNGRGTCRFANAPPIPENSSTTSGKVTVRMSMKTAAFILASFGTTGDLDMACELQC